MKTGLINRWFSFFNSQRSLNRPIASEYQRLLKDFLQKENITEAKFETEKRNYWKRKQQ